MAKKKNNTLKVVLITVGALLVLALVAKGMGWIGGNTTTQVLAEKGAVRTVSETVTASGKIQSATEVKLSSEVSGEVVELNVKEGDRVVKGQLLCKVRPDMLKSGYDRTVAGLNSQKAMVSVASQQLKQAEVNFINTEAKYKRNVELFNKRVLSAAEFDAAKAEFLAAKAGIESSKQNLQSAKYTMDQSSAAVSEAGANLAKTSIYAPVDGVISKLSIEKGDRILGTAQMSGTEIMRISNLSTMQVNVDVNENDVNRVSKGDTAIIQVDAFGDKRFKGIVTEIASSSTTVGTATTNTVDQVTNFLVKVRILPESYAELIKKDEHSLPSPFRPGLSATVDIQTESETGLSIPIQSVTTRNDKTEVKDGPDKKDSAEEESPEKRKMKLSDKSIKQYVFVLNAGKVKQVEVKTGIQNDKYIVLKSGITANDEVIVGPYSAVSKTLKDGMMVEKTTKDKLYGTEKKTK